RVCGRPQEAGRGYRRDRRPSREGQGEGSRGAAQALRNRSDRAGFMSSKTAKEGYLLLDNRLAPPFDRALIESWMRAGQEVVGAERALLESATCQCCHCNGTVVKNPDRVRARSWCSRCDAYECDLCAEKRASAGGECRPFFKLLDDTQEQAVFIASPN